MLTIADIHIGRVSADSESLDARASAREVWLRMADRAVQERVDAVVVAGDVVDQANKYFEAFAALETGLRKLNDAGISVIMTAGNHDFDVLPRVLENPAFDRVHFLGKDGKWEFLTLGFNGRKVQFVGWSFPSSWFREDPLAAFPVEKLNRDLPVIGLVHGDFGAVESVYAPLNLNTLRNAGADVWVLGHIHKPEVLNKENPLIYYPGSPQALSAKETGRHGATLLTLSENGRIETERIYFSTIRYEEMELDISELSSDEEILNRIMIAAGEFPETEISEEENYLKKLVLEVVLTGSHENIPALEAAISGWNAELGNFQRDVRGIKLSVRKISHRCTLKVGNLEELSREASPAGILAQAVLDLQSGQSSDFLKTLKAEGLKSMHSLNAHSTYQPLRNTKKAELVEEPELLEELLLEECNRLLSVLIQAKSEGR